VRTRSQESFDDQTEVYGRLSQHGAAAPLFGELLAEFRQRRDQAASGLAAARALADRPRGRFPDWKRLSPCAVTL